MRKLLALPKLLAVFTLAAAMLLPVGAASTQQLLNLECIYINNNGDLWCEGQSDGSVGQQGLLIGVSIISINASQHQVQLYWWNGYEWVYFHTGYHTMTATPQTNTWATDHAAWAQCMYNSMGSLWMQPNGINIPHSCGLPPSP